MKFRFIFMMWKVFLHLRTDKNILRKKLYHTLIHYVFRVWYHFLVRWKCFWGRSRCCGAVRTAGMSPCAPPIPWTNLSHCCHVRRRFPARTLNQATCSADSSLSQAKQVALTQHFPWTSTHAVTGPLCGLRRVPVPVPECSVPRETSPTTFIFIKDF